MHEGRGGDKDGKEPSKKGGKRILRREKVGEEGNEKGGRKRNINIKEREEG